MNVYLAGARSRDFGQEIFRGLEKLFSSVNPVEEGDRVAIKIHPGVYGSVYYIRPCYIRKIADLVKDAGGKPFVIETVALTGDRKSRKRYEEAANKNGFSKDSLGCRLVIDGSGVLCRVNGREIRKIEVSKEIKEADSLLVVSRAKGHVTSGYGGCIKNLGMGCISPSGKMILHEVTKPSFYPSKCKGCGRCAGFCRSVASAAISMNGFPEIDMERCIGCAACALLCCRSGALRVSVKQRKRFQLRLADAAACVLGCFERGKYAFFNFLLDVTLRCDCSLLTDVPLVKNIGILASRDPVAVDNASIDLIDSEEGMENSEAERMLPGEHKFRKIFGIDPKVQMRCLSKLGFGKMRYELKSLN